MEYSTPMPHLVVNDAEAAIKFYEAAFGATLTNKVPYQDGKRLLHVHMNLGGGALLFNDDFPEFGHDSTQAPKRLGGTTMTIHLDVPDADAAWKRALGAGAKEMVPLDNQFWGQRYGKLIDPFGHHWSIGGPVKK